MTDDNGGPGLASQLVLVIVAAVAAAVVAVAAQRWLLGDTGPAISGAVGALVPTLARRSRRSG